MQLGLFGPRELGVDEAFGTVHRRELGHGAWVEWAPNWLARHDLLFEQLRDGVAWRAVHTVMYEKRLSVPRLLGELPSPGPSLETLRRMSRSLSTRYGAELGAVSLAFYRDGQDSVAMHGDKMGPLVNDTIVAVVALGGPRTFLLKPATGGPSLRFASGLGDLIVMGGTCQRTYVHGVPKARMAAPRIAVMFRPELAEADPVRSVLRRPAASTPRSA